MKKYLAVDLGGTAIKYGVVDEELNFLSKGKIDARTDSKEDFYADIEKIYKEYGDGITGIGISMPGSIDRYKGFAHSGGAYRWCKKMPIASELSERLGCSVTICNDAKAAAMAEIGFGNLKGIRNGVAIILGTGIGGAVVVNHKLIDGSHYTAGEFSFLQGIYNNEPENNLEVFALQNGVQGLKNAIRASSDLDDIDGLKAFKLIKEENNEAVLQGVKNFCWYLSFYIYNLQTILDTDRFVIGGGISNEPMFIDLVKEAVEKRFNSAFAHLIPIPDIQVCRFQSDANLIGAVYNFMEIMEDAGAFY
ncbi:MAG: ROK family protein [Solobacterium sp.]|nr:ROK family protein [Solobacterium sp.]